MIRLVRVLGFVLASSWMLGCGGTEVAPDAAATPDFGAALDAASDAGAACTTDAQCPDDGLFCNGRARCNAGACMAGDPPCATGACNEATDRCTIVCPDSDGDGAADMACGGNDCDDSDPQRYPGNVEVCNQRDEDCDATTLGPDSDMDTFVGATCCNPQPSGTPQCGNDCDDRMRGVNVGATEACNGIDDNCSGQVDEGVEFVFYRDLDGDNAGRNDDTVRGCSAPAGYVPLGGDCNDTNRSINPSVAETCNGIDDNCDGMLDAGPGLTCACVDGTPLQCGEPAPSGMGFLMLGECRIGAAACTGGVRQPCVGAVVARPESSLACNGRDEDCDGVADDGVDVGCYVDADNDTYAPRDAMLQRLCPSSDPARESFGFCPFGYTSRAPTPTVFDCADSGASGSEIRPGAMEQCNNLDDDCNGMIDDGSGRKISCYVDNDGDGYAASATGAMQACTCPARTTPRAPAAMSSTDCNDLLQSISPAAPESCDAAMVDENCDGRANEDCGCAPLGSMQACPQPGVCGTGQRTCQSAPTGSLWGMCSIVPVSETCNGLDDDCNGSTDETFTCARTVAGTPGNPVGCTTTCGTAGQALCLGTCARDACRAATETCNFCDDNANGMSDQLEATTITSTVSAATCADFVPGAGEPRNCGWASIPGPAMGTRRIPGTVRVGYGDVTLRGQLEMFVSGFPSGSITLSLGYRSCTGGPCRFIGYKASWSFLEQPNDTFSLTEFSAAGSRLVRTTNSMAVPFVPFNMNGNFMGGTARRVELVFRAGVGAAPGRVIFRDAGSGVVVFDEQLAAPVLGVATAVEGTFEGNTSSGSATITELTIVPGATNTWLSAQQTCP